MTIQDELELSYYEDVGPYGNDGQMRLVKDKRDGRYFVKRYGPYMIKQFMPGFFCTLFSGSRGSDCW